jgi:hypothetical protein
MNVLETRPMMAFEGADKIATAHHKNKMARQWIQNKIENKNLGVQYEPKRSSAKK